MVAPSNPGSLMSSHIDSFNLPAIRVLGKHRPSCLYWVSFPAPLAEGITARDFLWWGDLIFCFLKCSQLSLPAVVTALTLLSTRRMPPQVFRAAVFVRQHGPLLFKMSSGCWGCLNLDFDVSVDNHGRGIMRVFKCIQSPERKALDCRRKWYLAAHRLSILFCPSECLLLWTLRWRLLCLHTGGWGWSCKRLSIIYEGRERAGANFYHQLSDPSRRWRKLHL